MAYTEILSHYLSPRNTEEKYKNQTLVTAAINPTENWNGYLPSITHGHYCCMTVMSAVLYLLVQKQENFTWICYQQPTVKTLQLSWLANDPYITHLLDSSC